MGGGHCLSTRVKYRFWIGGERRRLAAFLLQQFSRYGGAVKSSDGFEVGKQALLFFFCFSGLETNNILLRKITWE